MNPRDISPKTLLGSALFIMLALGTSMWLVTAEQERLYNEDLTRQLLTAARMLRDASRAGWEPFDAGKTAGLVHTLRSDDTVVVIVSTDGRLRVDTTGGSATADSWLALPAARQALLVGSGEQTGHLGEGSAPSQIVAVRAGGDQTTLGVVLLARPLWTVSGAWPSLGKLIAAICAIALASTIILTLLLTYLRTRLLRRLTETARSLSAGDLTAASDVAGSDEFAALSSALNQMRARLAAHVETIDRQRETLESLVTQLGEGVVVVRPSGHIALINPAALHLLSLAPAKGDDCRRFVGLALEHCIPQRHLQQMLSVEPSRNDDQTTRVQLDGDAGPRCILAHVSPVVLPDADETDGASPGRMLVLTDITELERTYQIKADFVANASHELRTPLSTIRVAVEALLSMSPGSDPENARRFVTTIDRHSRRLQELVSDLLDLSRLESPSSSFEPQMLVIERELEELGARFEAAAEARHVHWQTDCRLAPGQTVRVNAHLLRLTLNNLVDNALKFTPPDGRVRVLCRVNGDGVAFEVIDSGCGIPAEEQERIFERFYQIERARSGEQRGTGLGLSIVRHAAAAMRGEVTLESAVGDGTRVTVTIPLA